MGIQVQGQMGLLLVGFHTDPRISPQTPRATTVLRPTTVSREPELIIGNLLPREYTASPDQELATRVLPD